MKCLPMLLVASLITSTASAASASDVRVPTTSDEARALSAQRQGDVSPSALTKDCGLMPTTTDEARAATGARYAMSSAVASRATATERTARTPTSTDEARALVAAAATARVVASAVRYADACATL